MIWQVILIQIHNGIIKLWVTVQNTYIFVNLTFATNFLFPRKS